MNDRQYVPISVLRVKWHIMQAVPSTLYNNKTNGS